MLIMFKLNMPNRGSWDNKWSGEGNLYARVVGFRGKEEIELANKILSNEGYHYSFGDGWSAYISVTKVDSKEAVKIRRKTKGFSTYDWMIESIIKYGEIRAPKEW